MAQSFPHTEAMHSLPVSPELRLPSAVDCAIVGAGPAGLIAAIYLARFRRSLCLFDAGGSRASWIPVSHNLPGFPDAISGADFLTRLRAQAARYGVTVINAIVEAIPHNDQSGPAFLVQNRQQTIQAANIILATGAIDIEPDLPNLAHAVQREFIRHCPICDAFEAIDQTVGVLGSGSKLADPRQPKRPTTITLAHAGRVALMFYSSALPLHNRQEPP